MISIRNLNKNFGKLGVLKDVNLELLKGKSYALVGPNGSGKTTLIKSILGMVEKPVKLTTLFRSKLTTFSGPN